MTEESDKPSDAKIAANRQNAKKSTGPRTATGKAISSLNAITHGVFARHSVAAGPPLLESPAEFLALLESLRAHRRSPRGPDRRTDRGFQVEGGPSRSLRGRRRR